MKRCVLEEKSCVDCGNCDDRCQLNPQKICDNCFSCLEMDDRAYIEIPIHRVYTQEDYLPDAVELDSGPQPHVTTLYGMYGERKKTLPSVGGQRVCQTNCKKCNF